MRKFAMLAVAVCLLSFLSSRAFAGNTVWLDTLEMDQDLQKWGQPQRNVNYQRGPLVIAGKKYTSGVGVWARNVLWVDLGHGSGRFKANVGLDDSSTQGSVEFVIAIDGATVWRSGVMRHGDPAKAIDLDTNGKRYMVLAVEPGPSGDYQAWGDWCDAHWETQWSDPVAGRGERVEPYVLTPPAPKQPHLNNALEVGAWPNAPFHYTIPCTGVRPIVFTATGLPAGLSLDKTTGRISGTPPRPGKSEIALTAKNAAGVSTRPMEIVVGSQLALTPPMGWSSWNAWCANPNEERVLDAARSMIKFGLIDHGFTYVNIDDGWQAPRGGAFNGIQPQTDKFPQFADMVDQVHLMGLKFGVYSGPWICSYCGYTGGSSDNADGVWTTDLRNLPDSGHVFGKHGFEQNDARQWAAWGVDYLKYDWWPNDEAHTAVMSDALHASGRNIVFSVSNSASLDKGPMLEKYAQLWRASGDIRDNWPSLYNNGFSQSPWAQYSGPGHWADPDMMVLGNVGFDPDGWGQTTHASKLTPDEQYTHISLWCLLAAPLILGCDLTKLDPFTVGLLSNDEVIGVDQDPLGKPAVRVSGDYFHDVWMRPLSDGSYAVGVFNFAPGHCRYVLTPAELGLQGKYSVRDLWRQKDLGPLGDTFQTEVPGHGVRLLQLVKIGGS